MRGIIANSHLDTYNREAYRAKNAEAVKFFGFTVFRDYVTRRCRSYHSAFAELFEEIALFEEQDLEQEIWCRAFEYPKPFKTAEIFFVWVYRTLMNLMEAGRYRHNIVHIYSESKLSEADYNRYQHLVYGVYKGD